MEGAPLLLDHLTDEDRDHFDSVRELLDGAGVAYEVDPTLVRGLDYYTRTVFEMTSDELGAQSGVGGGGRYDGLMEIIGGPPTPGMGWAAGVERILLASPRPPVAPPPLDLYVAFVSDEYRPGQVAALWGTMNEKSSFFAELKRRNVYKVAVAYGVVAWLLMQVASQIFPFFDIPNWVVRVVVLLLIIGFPVALIIAWAFEVTPEGIKRTEAADAAGQRSRGGAWIYVVLIGAALSVGLFFVGRYTAGHATARPASEELRRGKQSEVATAGPDKSIAVLPLVNESGDPKDEYFSDGLSEELIAALAQISGLKVIGRSSSFRFKDRKEEPRTIGEKLGVSTLLDGTVRKQGDRVRIVAELVNAADGIQLWTRTFDRELKDIFAVQEEIAEPSLSR